MLVAGTLRAQAKDRKMKAGTVGLAEGHHPHARDAAELLKKGWASVCPGHRQVRFDYVLFLFVPVCRSCSNAHTFGFGNVGVDTSFFRFWYYYG